MKKQLLENCQRLRISLLKDVIPKGATAATFEIGTQEISVIGKVTNLRNGYRYYFICPKCLKPYESLFKSDFGSMKCRVCIGAVYTSTKKSIS